MNTNGVMTATCYQDVAVAYQCHQRSTPCEYGRKPHEQCHGQGCAPHTLVTFALSIFYHCDHEGWLLLLAAGSAQAKLGTF
jgi:hypothetical protein